MKLLLTMRRSFTGGKNIGIMSGQVIRLIVLWAALGTIWFPKVSTAAGEDEGVAVAIVYDTSGSMRESVRTATGTSAPKYRIANRALASIVDRMQSFATNNASASGPRTIHSGLFIFSGNDSKEAVRFGPFDAAAMRAWIKNYAGPDSGTPLGVTLERASQAVLKSKLARKHVVVVTDGINTVGPEPATVMARLKQQAARESSAISIHFVAFDVDAKVFDPVKKLGATVVGASNEEQLNAQLGFIFEKKILLEDEEPKPASVKPK